MLLVYNPSTDPAFNLAMEEYMLTQKKEPMILLWRNDNAVIIGKNQNAYQEMNLDYIKENDITVIRRQTGGGAVFHDLGNINFTFIDTYTQGDFNNYKKFTSPICDYLNTLGAHAELSGRNDLLIDGMKISGNAMTVKGDFIMSHGTLLFSANMANLAGALKPRDIKIASKGVKSVRSRVTNISSHIDKEMDVIEFLDALYIYLKEEMAGIEEYRLTNEDISAVKELVENKYSKWEWNFGYSPNYDAEKTKKFPSGIVEVHMNVKGMVIEQIKFYGDYFGIRDMSELEKKFKGVRHEREDLEKVVKYIDIEQYISGIKKEELIDLILG